nr:hypothetical protein GCM10020092_106190 [Actinoplanes digitatis]
MQGVEYSIEHHGHRFLILHNENAEDFAVACTSVDNPGDWVELIPHQQGTRLESVDAFLRHIVISQRRDGLTGLRVMADGSTDSYDMEFPEPIYSVSLAGNPEYDTNIVRISYTSMITPDSVYDVNLITRAMVLRKQKPVLGEFDPGNYEQFREWATAADGTRVPISVVARKGTPRNGTAPLLLYGYGSYEISMDPYFSIARLSLLDRGVVYAIAHIRGGGEMGWRWYEEGKMLTKKNTFTDFVAAAHALVAAAWTAPDRLVARGGSAAWSAHGRGREPGAGGLRGHRRAGAVRRPADVHSGPVAAADGHGVGGVGQPARECRRVRVHEVVQPVREHREAEVSRDPRRERPERHPRALPRA